MSGYLAALPPQWGKIIRTQGLSDGDFRNLCVLIGLCAHRNDGTGQCTPSVDRLAILLGLGKAGVLNSIQNLQNLGWLVCRKAPSSGCRERHEYTLPENPRESALIFPTSLLTNGLWSFLTPSERKVWLKLKAHSIHGANVVPDAFCGSDDGCVPTEDVTTFLTGGWRWHDFWFIPENVLEPDEWAAQLRMTSRTLTDAIKGLARLQMLMPASTVCPEGEPGLVLLVAPQPPDTRAWREHLNKFQERLSGLKRRQSSPGAKRLMAAVKSQQKKMVAQLEPTSAPQGTGLCTAWNQ